MAKSASPKPGAKITKRTLQRMFKGLAEEVMLAYAHFNMRRDIENQIGEYIVEMNNAPHFWKLTMRSHYQTAHAALCRLYDYNTKGINLRTLLKHLRLSTNQPSRAKRHKKLLPSEKQYQKDLKSVTWWWDKTTGKQSHSNPLVRKLLWQRHNLHAHKNLDNVLAQGKHADKHDLTYGEIEVLLERAKDILNRYGDLYRDNIWGTGGHNDLLHVLKSQRLWTKKDNDEISADEQEILLEPARAKVDGC